MKKILLILLTAFIGSQCKAQYNEYYASPGIEYSNHTVLYNAEVGINSEKTRFAIAANTSKNKKTNKWTTFIGIKPYFKVINVANAVDLYGFLGLYLGTYNPVPLEIEPGIAAVYNLSDTFALQLSGSVPAYTLYIFPNGRPTVSLGVNFYFAR